MRTALTIGVGLTLTLVTSLALAQGDPPATGTAGGTVSGTAAASTDTSATLPPPRTTAVATTTTTKKEDDGITDHEKVVGKFGVGYLGLTQLPIGAGGVTGVTRATLDAPVIGVRYWLMERLGIDGGIGFSLFSSSQEAEVNGTTTTVDGPAAFGLAAHVGLPLAFAYGKHYKFLVIPEINIGFTRRGEKQTGNNPPPDIVRTGFRFDVGARVGTEIQFGFIGVPELALQATVGLGFRRLAWSNSQDAGNGVQESSSTASENALGTTVQSDPWALFVNNISAIYYFP